MQQAVEVQLWLSKYESSFVSYDWITIGSIEYIDEHNTESIKEKIRALASESENRPFMNACRLKFQSGAKITMTGIW